MIEESVTSEHDAVTPPEGRTLRPDCFVTMTARPSEIKNLKIIPLYIELTEPFGIASGAQHRADNVLVSLKLGDGSVGIGEAAPFPAVSGETQAGVAAALESFAPFWLGRASGRWRERCAEAEAQLAGTPSAVCAVQSALLDAWLRSHRVSMWKFFGGQQAWLETDITIPTGSVAHAVDAAQRARAAGFRTLKVKVGGSSVDEDARRLRKLAAAAPECSLVLDANGGFSALEALELLRALGSHKDRVGLFEQPTPREDLEALKKVSRDGHVAVAADESARNVSDVLAIARSSAASAVNIKLTKSGLLGALDMIHLAKGHGLELMIGGMVESRLCMCVSACMAGGLGGFRWVDLDTPLFMKDSPLRGGYEQRGAGMRLDRIERGHGVRWQSDAPPDGAHEGTVLR